MLSTKANLLEVKADRNILWTVSPTFTLKRVSGQANKEPPGSKSEGLQCAVSWLRKESGGDC